MGTQRTETDKAQKKANRSDRVFFGCICILIAAFVLQRLIKGYFDNDFFHIATSGRWIAQNGIMRQNVFFVKDGYETVIQQWLYGLMLNFSYQSAGYYGVFLFTLLQAVLFGTIGYGYLIKRGTDQRVSVIGALLLVLSVMELNCRPEIISMCLFTVQMICQEEFRRTKKAGVLFVLPFLMLLEINLHAAYAVFHFILLMPYLVPAHRLPICRELMEWCGIRKEDAKRKPYILPVLLMIAAMFANPYGIKAITVVLYSGNIRLLHIYELQATTIKDDAAVLFVFGFLFLGMALRRKSVRESTILMFAGCLLMGLIASKNIQFFSLVLLMLWGDLFESFDCKSFWEFLAGAKRGYATAALAASVVLAAALLLYGTLVRISPEHEISNGLLPDLSDSENYPADAIAYILEHESAPQDLRVMTSFNNGSAFLWNGIGHVYLEPKTEPYLRAINRKYDVVSEYVQITEAADSEQLEVFLKQYDFDYIVCSYCMQGLLVYLEQHDAYECVLTSEVTENSCVQETGYAQPIYRLYRKAE